MRLISTALKLVQGPTFAVQRVRSARMASTLPRLLLFEALTRHDPQSVAVRHSLSGRAFTYGSLVQDVVEAKERLRGDVGGRGLEGERIAFLIENCYDYVVTLLAVLANHAIAVPLSPEFPPSELRYVVNHSEALAVLSSAKFKDKAAQLFSGGELEHAPVSVAVEKKEQGNPIQRVVAWEDGADSKGGLMLYTSGTTSRPKGVVLPTSALVAQCRSLIEAWKYSSSDHLLHVLPLHHIHGTVNALLTPLVAGSTIEFMFPFKVDAVWQRLAAPFLAAKVIDHQPPPPPAPKVTFFTAVPTIYSRLLTSHPLLSSDLQQASREAITPANLRLNISGSAALPTPTKAAWAGLSGGNVLLERYGMTEVGMALSCGLATADRVDGSVGWPLPSVEARLVDPDSGAVIAPDDDVAPDGRERLGEIQLRGPTLFREYWRNPDATAAAFTSDDDDGGAGRWFRTGDVAVRRAVAGAGAGGSGGWAHGKMFFIAGRRSADIIKTGGEKVSALEVEREMLGLAEVGECAVVALPSELWGQRVAAVVVLSEAGKAAAGRAGRGWGPLDMRRALRERLAVYKIPQEMKVVEGIPRNAMGKINKKQLVKELFGQ